MKLDTLFDNYDLLMDSPNSTVKMRKLILQLAVQGKLVEQDPTNEPAGELLKRIKAEKEKLIAERKIKKQKPLLPVAEEEIPYELPPGWEWVRLAELCTVTGGKRVPKGYQLLDQRTQHIYIRVTDMKKGTIDNNNLKYISNDVYEKIKKYIITKNDLYITIAGTIGQVGEVPDKFHNMNLTENAARIIIHIADKRFLRYSLSSAFIQNQFLFKANQMAQPKLAIKRIETTIFPLPPLAEQKRIVAKVDQLMQLCDQLDACQEKASTKYTSLNDAALEKLLSSKTIDEFANHWQFLCNNFDLIYNDPAHVNKLRQAILQLAVQGKLAPQDPNDEPASELLKRIKAEKEKLIAEGKLKKQKPLSPIAEDEIPYELPQRWEWVRLGELCEINPRINVDNDEIDVSFIPMKMISEKYGTPHSFERKKWAEVKKGFTYFMDNDVGLAKITPCFENGKSTVFKGLLNGVGAGTTELHIFRQKPKLILPEYVLIFFKCPKFLNDAKEKMTGSAGQKRVPREFIRFVPFSLPSLTEQKRIVAKVDQLMNLCDELETRLNQSKKDSEMLMQAVLHEAFS
ncbi:MAG: type I restriction enzyme, S subunit [Desulfobacteraceae bacterium Eth-SRB1]|nr:MAG: type I restriction enzyme, S subunit [Desulfobacteraceae bacterium Eth-SRB1]